MNSDKFYASSIPNPRKLLLILSFLTKLSRQKATLGNGIPSSLVPWFPASGQMSCGQSGVQGSFDVRVSSQKSPCAHGQLMEGTQESRDEVLSQPLGGWH